MTTPTTPSYHMETARNRKALAFARHFWTADVAPETVADLSEREWAQTADLIDEHWPSFTTRGIVVTVLCALEEFSASRSPA